MLDAAQPLDLLDRVGEGIFALDQDWRFAYLNRQAERVLSRLSGSPSTNLVGTVIWDRPALADSSLGRALHRQFVIGLAARGREAAVHAARLADTAQALRLVADGYRGAEDDTRRASGLGGT